MVGNAITEDERAELFDDGPGGRPDLALILRRGKAAPSAWGGRGGASVLRAVSVDRYRGYGEA